MTSSFEGSSSDWLTALLDRPLGKEADPLPAPLSWLPDFGRGDDAGFVEGMAFDRPSKEPAVALTTGPDPDDPGQEPTDLPVADTGDALEDILRRALAQDAADEPAEPDPQPEPQPETQPAPQPDPIAEAFARGEVAGREAALAEQEALATRKFELRQTFRTLDQAAMDALAGELGETVITLCAQTLADYAPDQSALHSRCLEAARRLGKGVSGAVLHLHPDDCALLDEASLTGWQVVGDPLAQRGSLRFETQDGSISDSPSDWRRAIAAAIRG